MGDLSGKGIYIWIIKDTDDPKQIAESCKDAGLSHAAIKVADAGYTYNISNAVGDKAAALVTELHARGIQAWGWQFVYGNAPEAEANMAIKRAIELDLDGFIVNAESAYKGKHASAEIYMDKLRRALNGYCPIALSSFRFPSYHQEFPWQEFLSKVDINMPQVYWMMATNAGAQMERCYAEFKQPQYPQVPIFPTGAAFSEHGWRAYPDEVNAFMDAAKRLGVKGCNFWNYDHAFNRFPELWDAISSFKWDGAGYEDDPVDEDDFMFYAMCEAEALRIRTGPSTAWPIVDHLVEGDVEPVYGVENGWYRIDRGWVGGSYMTKIAPPSPPVEEPTIEQRLDRIEADLDKLLALHPEVYDAL